MQLCIRICITHSYKINSKHGVTLCCVNDNENYWGRLGGMVSQRMWKVLACTERMHTVQVWNKQRRKTRGNFFSATPRFTCKMIVKMVYKTVYACNFFSNKSFKPLHRVTVKVTSLGKTLVLEQFLFLLLLDNQQTPLSWDITPMTRCRGSELRQAIPKDVQGIALDSRSIDECVPLWNCAKKKEFLCCDMLVVIVLNL